MLTGLENLFRGIFKKATPNVDKTTSWMNRGTLNTEIEPSLFTSQGKKFIGDYIGKFAIGYEYAVADGLLILDEPAMVERKATKEEVDVLESAKKLVFGPITPICFIEEM